MSQPRPLALRMLALALLLSTLVAKASAVADESLSSFSTALRPIILNALPKPLYEKSENWGNAAPGIERIRWHRLRPEVVRSPQNDGHWRKTRVAARDPEKSLEFQLSDFKAEGVDRLAFKAFLALTVHVEREDEFWEKGLRLVRETAEARLRIMAHLDAEAGFRFVGYDNLVVENIGGIGGTGARWLGEGIRSSLKQWKPSIERELLTRANTAVLKAADTKEVRLSLTSLLDRQNKK